MTSITDIVLTHHSLKELILDDRDYVQELGHKPRGLWLSDDSDYGWKEWCESESWNTDSLLHSSDYQFTDDANILWLSSESELKAFTREHGSSIRDLGSMYNIDWLTVTSQYDGILITPYQWSCRMGGDTFWYYTWDVASACVWNTNILKEVSNVRTEATR